MYLLSATDIAALLSGPLNGTCSVPDIVRFQSVLSRVLTRVEEAMNVHSLSRGNWEDRFSIDEDDHYREVDLRLSNGFVVDGGQITITDKLGNPVEAEVEVDNLMGIVRTTLPSGVYKVGYSSGLAADGTSQVFIGTPEWLKSIASIIFIQWARLTYGAGTLKDVSYASLSSAMIREIQTRVYERYMRPRAAVLWADRSVREVVSE